MRDIERKREYDRQRMARLHAEGRTWWQQRDRSSYDSGRSLGNQSLRMIDGARAAFGVELDDATFWQDARLVSGRQSLRSQRVFTAIARLDELNGFALVNTSSGSVFGGYTLRFVRMPEDIAPAGYRRRPWAGCLSTGWNPRAGRWACGRWPGEYDGKSTEELQSVLAGLREEKAALSAQRTGLIRAA
jgi:hypothetical protein